TTMLRAVQIRRRLAEANPQAHAVELTRTLNSLGLRLAEVGRHGEAVLATGEGLSIMEARADADPAAYERDVCGARINPPLAFHPAGRQVESAGVGLGAVTVCRNLVHRNDGHAATLATAVYNAAVALSTVERYGEAITLAQEAIALRRRLAEQDPARFVPET